MRSFVLNVAGLVVTSPYASTPGLRLMTGSISMFKSTVTDCRSMLPLGCSIFAFLGVVFISESLVVSWLPVPLESQM